MRHLHLIIHATDGQPVPTALAGLLARAAPLAGDTSLSGMLCQALNIARQQDWPVAPCTARAADLEAGRDYWLRLDPVHLDIGMRGPFLHAGLSLGQEETRALQAILSPLLQEHGMTLIGVTDGVCLLRLASAPRLSCTPLDRVHGRPPTRFLPTGEDAPFWTQLLNEMQMSLHEHPFNQARAARGELPVNSLWLWGGGRFEMPARGAVEAAWGDAPLLRDLARATGIAHHAEAQGLGDILPARLDHGLVLLDAAAAAASLSADWLRPLLAALRLGRLRSARIDWLGEDALGIALTPLAAWRIWR